MSKKLDLSTKLDFNDVDLTPPSVVVQEIAAQISQQTNENIYGEVSSYSGPVDSYVKQGIPDLALTLGRTDKKIDIQTTLGKQGEEIRKFEFYLKTPLYAQYKYRICYLQHEIGNYPVKVVLEENIAKELKNNSYKIYCKNPVELEELIVNAIYSKTVISIMQELIRINQVQRELTANSDNSGNDETTE